MSSTSFAVDTDPAVHIRRAPRTSPFDELQYVFNLAGTALLAPAEERALAERLWQGRRRLRVAMVWSGLGRNREVPPDLKPHTGPLSTGLRKRLIQAEKEARAHLENEEFTTGNDFKDLLSREIDAIEKSRETLLRHNLRLVAWIAKGFQKKGLDLLDLFQEGAIALLWSIDRFDPARETRLSTFASYAIRLGIIRALADKGRAVRIPIYRLKDVVSTSSVRSRLAQQLGREPHFEEIEKEAGMPRESLEEILAAVRPMVSIDAHMPGTDLPFSDVLLDQASPSPFELAARSEASDLAGRALLRLPERERRIVSMRYGLGDTEERSYEDIGHALGISRERTRQLESAARGKLRAVIESGRN